MKGSLAGSQDNSIEILGISKE